MHGLRSSTQLSATNIGAEMSNAQNAYVAFKWGVDADLNFVIGIYLLEVFRWSRFYTQRFLAR
jgi:hypothetical protein